MRALRIISIVTLLIIGRFQGTRAMELVESRPLLEMLPKDLWEVIADKLPGDNTFLNELARRLMLSDTTYRKIVDAYINKTNICPLSDDVDTLLWLHFRWTKSPEIRDKFKKAFLASIRECPLSCYTTKEDIPLLLNSLRPVFPDAVVAGNGHVMQIALDGISPCRDQLSVKKQIEFYRGLEISVIYALRLLGKYSYDHTLTGKVTARMTKPINLNQALGLS